MNNYEDRRNEIARRFLQHVVIIDDKAYENDPDKIDEHDLDTKMLTNSFLGEGLICGAIIPRFDEENKESVESGFEDNPPSLAEDSLKDILYVAKRADIVVLDWQLHDEDSDNKAALSILKNIMKEDRDERLRLIVIYTGDSDITSIPSKINSLNVGLIESDENQYEFSRGHCYVYVYMKHEEKQEPELMKRYVDEVDLPKKLIERFLEITEGLLPTIALMSLSAIRDNAHKILDRFDADLDPAYLAHSIYLSSSEDAEQHMIDQIVGELHAIIDDAAESYKPARIDAINCWVDRNNDLYESDEKWLQFEGHKKLDMDEAKELISDGLNFIPESKRKKVNISSGFVTDDGFRNNELDHKLAWMMNFRTIHDAGDRKLHLGTVIRRQSGDDSQLLICMQPRCDSVRLDDIATTFLFLPLVEVPADRRVDNKILLIVETESNHYKTFYVEARPSRMSAWVMEDFTPHGNGYVKAESRGEDFYFLNSSGNVEFKWIGEMKPEFAQRVAQHFAGKLERVATNNSEWLRRRESGV